MVHTHTHPLPLHRSDPRDARAIVVVEKEGVFQQLVQDSLTSLFPCIIVTGKGFPDIATRAFVHDPV